MIIPLLLQINIISFGFGFVHILIITLTFLFFTLVKKLVLRIIPSYALLCGPSLEAKVSEIESMILSKVIVQFGLVLMMMW